MIPPPIILLSWRSWILSYPNPDLISRRKHANFLRYPPVFFPQYNTFLDTIDTRDIHPKYTRLYRITRRIEDKFNSIAITIVKGKK